MSILDRTTGTSDIWIHDLERNVRSRFTFGPLNETFPVWTPDGSALYFSMSEGLMPDLYRKSLVGTTAEEMVVEGEGVEIQVGLSADGRQLAFTALKAGGGIASADILILDLEAGGDPTPFLADEHAEWGGRFSPSGAKLLYLSMESGRVETYVATFPVPARRWQISTSGGGSLGWTSDGREIVLTSTENEVVSVRVDDTEDDLVIGAPEVLFDASRYQNLWMTKDGQAFYATKRAQDVGTDTITVISDWLAVAKPEER
jgi:Tol biopolymer transport system component